MGRFRAVCAIVMVAVLWAVCATAGGGGSFGLYLEAQGLNCNFLDNQPAVLSIYVVAALPDGATASRFAAPVPACMTGATWLSDTPVFSTSGDSQTGVVVTYGSCLTGTAHILTIDILVQGTSDLCCYYPILPDPDVFSGRIETVDCSDTVVFGLGKFSVVNGDETCPCGGTIPVEETTWGKLKTFYN